MGTDAPLAIRSLPTARTWFPRRTISGVHFEVRRQVTVNNDTYICRLRSDLMMSFATSDVRILMGVATKSTGRREQHDAGPDDTADREACIFGGCASGLVRL
jgi:hypothetical protein